MKNTKRVFLLLLLLCTVFAGCGNNGGGNTGSTSTQQPVEMDINTVAKDIISSLALDSEPVQIQDKTVEKYYDTTLAESYVMYAEATGAYAEEITVFKAASPENVAAIEAMFTERINSQRTRYESYVPAEVVKIDAAVIVVNGDYVALIIAADPTPAKTVFAQAAAN